MANKEQLDLSAETYHVAGNLRPDKVNGGHYRVVVTCHGDYVGNLRDNSSIEAQRIRLILAAPKMLARSRLLKHIL